MKSAGDLGFLYQGHHLRGGGGSREQRHGIPGGKSREKEGGVVRAWGR